MKSVPDKYSHRLYVSEVFTTSTFSFLHVLHQKCMTFNIRGAPSTRQHSPSISIFTTKETKNMSQTNILMNSTFPEYFRLLHFISCIFHIQIAWPLLFVVLQVQGCIHPQFLYSLKRDTNNMSERNILMDSTFWKYFHLLHFFVACFTYTLHDLHNSWWSKYKVAFTFNSFIH